MAIEPCAKTVGGKLVALVAPTRSRQGKKTHQVKGKKQAKIENELMDRMTRRERTETVEEMDLEQIKKSEGTMERAVQGTVCLCVVCSVRDKQEMMEIEMMNLMRKRGEQNTQEGASENPEKVKRNNDKLKCAAPIYCDPIRKVSFVETSWAAGNVSVHGMRPDFAEFPALCSQCVVLVFPELPVLWM